MKFKEGFCRISLSIAITRAPSLLQTKVFVFGLKRRSSGSAEVVGLMCLHVFTDGKQDKFDELKPYAMSLGAAFQKVNFLRDMKADYQDLGRTYFPNVDMTDFTESAKKEIEKPFPQEEELKTKSKRLDELNIKLNLNNKDKEIIDDGNDISDDSQDCKKEYER